MSKPTVQPLQGRFASLADAIAYLLSERFERVLNSDTEWLSDDGLISAGVHPAFGSAVTVEYWA